MWTNIEQPPDLSKITEIDISYNYKQLIKIPDWICKCNNLITLNCSYNLITHIPNTLPDSLQKFICFNNQITQIPNTLPNSLQKFSCSENQITQIPNTLPKSLQIFLCCCNQITQIPDTLPDSLQVFECYNNNMTQIPMSIINSQKLTHFTCNQNTCKPPIIKYFLNNLDNENIKKYCYDLMWQVRMEF